MLSGETVTKIWPDEMMVTAVDPNIAGLTSEVAVIAIVAGTGAFAGAV